VWLGVHKGVQRFQRPRQPPGCLRVFCCCSGGHAPLSGALCADQWAAWLPFPAASHSEAVPKDDTGAILSTGPTVRWVGLPPG
jgi:hypothetical protein